MPLAPGWHVGMLGSAVVIQPQMPRPFARKLLVQTAPKSQNSWFRCRAKRGSADLICRSAVRSRIPTKEPQT